MLEQFGATDDLTVIANEKWLAAAELAALRVPAVPAVAPTELMPPVAPVPAPAAAREGGRVASADAHCPPSCTTEQTRW